MSEEASGEEEWLRLHRLRLDKEIELLNARGALRRGEMNEKDFDTLQQEVIGLRMLERAAYENRLGAAVSTRKS